MNDITFYNKEENVKLKDPTVVKVMWQRVFVVMFVLTGSFNIDISQHYDG